MKKALNSRKTKLPDKLKENKYQTNHLIPLGTSVTQPPELIMAILDNARDSTTGSPLCPTENTTSCAKQPREDQTDRTSNRIMEQRINFLNKTPCVNVKTDKRGNNLNMQPTYLPNLLQVNTIWQTKHSTLNSHGSLLSPNFTS